MDTNKISVILALREDSSIYSTWLDLNNFKDWNELVKKLQKQDFECHEIDTKLYIQEIDGFPYEYIDWKNISPKTLFELLQQSGVLTDNDKYEKMLAYIEVQSFEIWQELVLKNSDAWDEDIYLYPKYDWYDYGKMIFSYSGLELPKFLEMFFDFEGLGEHFKHYDVQEYSNGLIQII